MGIGRSWSSRERPGFELLKIEHKMGSRGYETASFALDDVRVPAENLLGGEDVLRTPARASRAPMATFNITRPLHAAQGVGMGRAALDHALDFVRAEYPAHGRRRQRALERLAEIRRGSADGAADLPPRGVAGPRGRDRTRSRRRTPSCSRRRLYSAAVSAALDILGEAGVRNDRMLEKLYRDVKILDIGEGTQQVQRLVVARQLFGFPRSE